MANISVRLPPDVEKKLDEEMRRTARSRSELVREAVGDYLTRKQKERVVAEMRRAARALYSDPDAKGEATAVAEEGVEDWLENIDTEERAAGVDPEERWWD
ncbi:ribbon-helix-helix protein, CopG family [Halomonas denitrificans]|nr:ribbon-helix-helix protein, CopG family [Halomonas denitrificans]